MRRDYPATRIEQVTETLSGVSFPDPYRWLESESEEVARWQREQAELATAAAKEWPHFDRLREIVTRFSGEGRVALPRYAAGKWFRVLAGEGTAGSRVLVANEPFGTGRVLYDASQETEARSPFVSWISPSPDGRTLALGLCPDGSENNTIRLIDVETGVLLPDAPAQLLMDNWTGGAHWLTDSTGFFFAALSGAAADFVQCICLHRRRPTPSTVVVEIPWNTAHDYRMVTVSPDGRYAVALERLQNPVPIAIASLQDSPLKWRPFVGALEGTVAGHIAGNEYIAITDVDAPRGRLVAIPLEGCDPADPKNWKELVPQSDAVLRTVTPVGNALYLTELLATYARVRRVDVHGRELDSVPLPGQGAVGELPFSMMNLVPRGHPQQFIFAFSSLTVSWGIYRHVPGQSTLEILRAPAHRIDDVIVEDRWVVSTDGARVPYHVVRPRAKATGAAPTLIYGYGGFNVPFVPQFPGPIAAFVAAGGTLVHAHLRGGGELGLEWWQQGRMRRKQQGYDDLFAIAEDLIASGVTSRERLAVTGASNGGTMAANAATQRPDLWAVAIPRVAVLDQIGACRDAYARQSVVEEKADIDDPREVERLARISPYHLVRQGVRYPAIYIDMGGTDPRCPAWHGRKLAARLQSVAACEAPIVLHVWPNAGHGWATSRQTVIAEYTEWLAFTLRHLGVR